MKKVFVMSRRYGVLVLAAGAGAANAAVDTTAITTAQTDALTVVAALTALGIAVWGANYIRRKFFS